MAYFVIPDRKEWNRHQRLHHNKSNFDEMFKDFICDVCGKHLVSGDAYYVVRTDEQVIKDGKPAFRHVKCDKE